MRDGKAHLGSTLTSPSHRERLYLRNAPLQYPPSEKRPLGSRRLLASHFAPGQHDPKGCRMADEATLSIEQAERCRS